MWLLHPLKESVVSFVEQCKNVIVGGDGIVMVIVMLTGPSLVESITRMLLEDFFEFMSSHLEFANFQSIKSIAFNDL